MREFKNGNVDEFFTKDEFDELKKEHCFKDPETVRERIAHLYAFNRPEANCEPLMTAKEVNLWFMYYGPNIDMVLLY